MKKVAAGVALLLTNLSLFAAELQTAIFLPSYNMPEGVTPVSHRIFQVHMTVFWICVVVGAIVFSIMAYSIVNHRKSKGHKAEQFHENMFVEIIWTTIPAIILVLMAIPATQILIDMHDTSKADMTIQITGYQWKWRYHYLEQDLDFFSNTTITEDEREGRTPKGPHYMHSVDNELVLPIHKKIRFLVTANDVIHSWWVPALGVKQDALPGFINEKWAQINRPGLYYGQCTELCGVNHGFMPIVVRAVSEQEFKDWVAAQKGETVNIAALIAKEWTMAELMERGRSTFNTTCAACHKPSGEGAPPVFPALKGAKITTQESEKEHNIKTVLFGRPGTAMQAFGTQFNAIDLAAVLTYIRNAWGNNTGDIVQPSAVQDYLGKK